MPKSSKIFFFFLNTKITNAEMIKMTTQTPTIKRNFQSFPILNKLIFFKKIGALTI